MRRLRLSLACWAYDRVEALANGSVVPEGIDLTFLPLDVEETFFRMLRHGEFDVAEMSISSFCVTLNDPRRPFVAIPVFPSCYFRHRSIFVCTQSGVRRPEDLRGKRIGVPEYQMSAPVWIRGILHDHHGLDPASVTYFTGGEEEPGREEKLKLDLPEKFRIERIGPGKTLARMLADGEIDGLHTARTPSTYQLEPGKVQRLFPDYVAAEQSYFRQTGIFPIMHVIAIRREVYEANRWIARSLTKAFDASLALAMADLHKSASLKTMLPWQTAAVEQAGALLGEHWWPRGLETTRPTLETFLRYHHEQGLSSRRLGIEDMFAPETFTSYLV